MARKNYTAEQIIGLLREAELSRLSMRQSGLLPDYRTIGRVAVGAAIGFALVGVHTLLIAMTGHIAWHWNAAFDPHQLVTVLTLYALLATREELAFHGWPFRLLASSWGALGAQVVVAILFAVEHTVGGVPVSQAILGAGIGSLVFGAVALRTGGVAMPIGLHLAWNLGDWARGGKDATGILTSAVDRGYEAFLNHVSLAAYVAVMLPVSLLLVMVQRGPEADRHQMVQA